METVMQGGQCHFVLSTRMDSLLEPDQLFNHTNNNDNSNNKNE